MISASVMKGLSANPTKWSNTLKQLIGNLPTNCLSVFDHFEKLALKGLRTNPLFKVSVLTELFTIENVTNVIGKPSAIMFLFRFLIGKSL